MDSFYPVSWWLWTFLQRAKLPDKTQPKEDLFHTGRLICGLQKLYMQHRVSLYAQTLTSQIYKVCELTSTHVNVYKVCKLTSTRLRNDRWRNDRHSLHKPTYLAQANDRTGQGSERNYRRKLDVFLMTKGRLMSIIPWYPSP